MEIEETLKAFEKLAVKSPHVSIEFGIEVVKEDGGVVQPAFSLDVEPLEYAKIKNTSGKSKDGYFGVISLFKGVNIMPWLKNSLKAEDEDSDDVIKINQ